jgi:hypothetical protein
LCYQAKEFLGFFDRIAIVGAFDFYFPHMKYGKFWFHLQKNIFFIANLNVLGLFLPKISDALVGACQVSTYCKLVNYLFLPEINRNIQNFKISITCFITFIVKHVNANFQLPSFNPDGLRKFQNFSEKLLSKFLKIQI